MKLLTKVASKKSLIASVTISAAVFTSGAGLKLSVLAPFCPWS